MIERLTSSMTPTYLNVMKPETYGAWLQEMQHTEQELHAHR
jgi:hypothetical protein